MKKYDKEKLENYIFAEKMPYDEIGKLYGCSGANIRKIAKRLGIELPQRRKINESETFNKGTGRKTYCLNCGKDISHKYKNIYCDHNCQNEYEANEKYKYFLTEPEEFQRANYSPYKWIKPFVLKEQNGVCDICGCEPIHNEKELVFILDHIDGDASHNIRSNLRLVCPNCDSQLDTYKSKNKNSSRLYRYKKE